MTIDEATAILEDILTFVRPGDPPEEHESIKLGIEALKRVKECRPNTLLNAGKLLPGETE